MLRINMSQQYAKISLDIQKADLELHTTPPQLEIHTQAAIVEITSGSGQLEIDQTPCRESYGFRTSAALSQAFAEEGVNSGFEAIGNISEEGDRMMRIESGENVIATIAAEKNEVQIPDVELQLVNPPIIDYRPTPVHYRTVPGKVDIEFQPGTVENNSEPGRVTTTMAQDNRLDIWVTGSMTDMKA